MYQVLYRKWRPKTFDEVAGQDHITATLKREVAEQRLAHAYLFTGSRGTGKTSCARILAKAINCLNPINGNPCNECEICKSFDNDTNPDMIEMDAASNNGIDDIRKMVEEINFTPMISKKRIYIIDEVHMLSKDAFNGLLKILEEPPEHITYIFATTEINKVLPTILSRCQRFDFGRISDENIINRINVIAAEEHISISAEAVRLIARIADGGMRDALSLLDKSLGISENVDENVVTEAAGVANKSYLFDLSTAFYENNPSAALRIVNELHANSYDSENICSELVNHFRNMMIIKSVKNPERILKCTMEEADRLKNESEKFTTGEIINIINVINETLTSIKNTRNSRVETDLAMMRICGLKQSSDSSALLARIERLEKEVEQLKKNGVQLKTISEQLASNVKEEAKINAAAEEKSLASEQLKTVDLSSPDFEDDKKEYADEEQIESEEKTLGVRSEIEPNVEPEETAPVAVQKKTVDLSSLEFEDDSTDYENEEQSKSEKEDFAGFNEEPVFDEIPKSDEAPVFDEAPIFEEEPVFNEAPVFDEEPVFDEAPVFDEEPVFDADPVFDSEPVFDENSAVDEQPMFDPKPVMGDFSNESSDGLWARCIAAAEPQYGVYLFNTKADINGNILTISDYNIMLKNIFPVFEKQITEMVKRVTGREFIIRLDENGIREG
ncbi:MAG: DNA polymerase III subunit gamma/tau [Clostridiales bacterium]|nr:DNA polymerase III subunit gamma/tau [Clostridiales bacterium]